jgi:hypothetical protein
MNLRISIFVLLFSLLGLALGKPVQGKNPDFIPDEKYKGTAGNLPHFS